MLRCRYKSICPFEHIVVIASMFVIGTGGFQQVPFWHCKPTTCFTTYSNRVLSSTQDASMAGYMAELEAARVLECCCRRWSYGSSRALGLQTCSLGVTCETCCQASNSKQCPVVESCLLDLASPKPQYGQHSALFRNGFLRMVRPKSSFLHFAALVFFSDRSH